MRTTSFRVIRISSRVGRPQSIIVHRSTSSSGNSRLPSLTIVTSALVPRTELPAPALMSCLSAAAHAVPGVESVEVLTFQRQHEPWSSGIDSGVIPMGRLEIARLDDDPNFPEHGRLTLTMGGGK